MLVVAVIGLLLVLVHILLIKIKAKNLMLLLSSVYSLYFLLEIITYLLICTEIIRPDFYSINGDYFGAADRPYVKFDSISGYKYIPGRPRVAKVEEGQLVYDHIMPINNRGYCSIYDFPFKKADKTKKRLMVLGDSFSAGEITDTTWVDVLNMKLSAASKPIELFNFGLEAIGISAWHNMFFKEIVPNYEFDGIVIANFGDLDYYSSDMARPFAIKHSGSDHSCMGFVESLPKSESDFEKNYLAGLYYESSIYNTEKLEHYKLLAMHEKGTARAFKIEPLHLYFVKLITEAVSFIREYNAMKAKYILKTIPPAIKDEEVKDWKNFDFYYGKRAGLTKEILDYCVSNKKEIYLISIPSFNIAEADTAAYHHNIFNRQLRFLAKNYRGSFFDGFAMMDSIPRYRDGEFHLYNDSHWNRRGVDLFVKTIPVSFFEQNPDK